MGRNNNWFYKLNITDDIEELYDISKDPLCNINIVKDNKDVAHFFKEKIREKYSDWIVYKIYLRRYIFVVASSLASATLKKYKPVEKVSNDNLIWLSVLAFKLYFCSFNKLPLISKIWMFGSGPPHIFNLYDDISSRCALKLFWRVS